MPPDVATRACRSPSLAPAYTATSHRALEGRKHNQNTVFVYAGLHKHKIADIRIVNLEEKSMGVVESFPIPAVKMCCALEPYLLVSSG